MGYLVIAQYGKPPQYRQYEDSGSTKGSWCSFHICERNYDRSLPEWMKRPLCRNGGIGYKNWTIYEIDNDPVGVDGCCGTCKRIAMARFFEEVDKHTESVFP